MTSPAKGSVYLYGIRAGAENQHYGTCGIGGSEVYPIVRDEVAAIVSDMDCVNLRPERRNIAAHRDVLSMLMKESTVLPMAFGIVAENREAVMKILSKNREVFARQLRKVAGKVEMGLKVAWDVPNIFEYFVLTQPELRVARDQIVGRGEPSQEQKIDLGRMFDRLLNDEREAQAERVEEVLSECCKEISQGKCRNEKEVMNLACLISRDDQGEFEKVVLKAAGLFDENYTFDYNGPWAPHNFVNIDLKL